MKLKDIAYARSGDKGSLVNIGIIAYDPSKYPYLVEKLTEEKVASFFKHLHPKKITRYELPNLYALNFVLSDVLEGGGSLNLRGDAQGKALAVHFLEMEI